MVDVNFSRDKAQNKIRAKGKNNIYHGFAKSSMKEINLAPSEIR